MRRREAAGVRLREQGGVRLRRFAGDGGGATVFVCLALTGLIGATSLVGQVGAVVVARHFAQAGADLAALAVAGALDRGIEVACAEGAEVARRNGARIRECEVRGWEATVTTTRKIPMGLFGSRTVVAMARAGPVDNAG
ncbi:Rv3654c family TadE-like protein [Nocardia puris]|uniref:Rv3654c family TadE-like protein n=1 Tax=Nocardia puris TaxID=208602 RepID=UPI002B4AD990|nr:Rv3654c family TadE-like protein [Nocardia puris]